MTRAGSADTTPAPNALGARPRCRDCRSPLRGGMSPTRLPATPRSGMRSSPRTGGRGGGDLARCEGGRGGTRGRLRTGRRPATYDAAWGSAASPSPQLGRAAAGGLKNPIPRPGAPEPCPQPCRLDTSSIVDQRPQVRDHVGHNFRLLRASAPVQAPAGPGGSRRPARPTPAPGQECPGKGAGRNPSAVAPGTCRRPGPAGPRSAAMPPAASTWSHRGKRVPQGPGRLDPDPRREGGAAQKAPFRNPPGRDHPRGQDRERPESPHGQVHQRCCT